MKRQALGRWGEQRAADFLVEKGYTILARNLRTPYGEIDLVACQPGKPSQRIPDTVVFVEVKTRSSDLYGFPEESINARKRLHILASIQAYLQDNPQLTSEWRVDVIAIQLATGDQPPDITHFENAIGA
jgi:putative endonuclease